MFRFTTKILYSKIGVTGVLETWQTATKEFISGREYHTSVAFNGYFYIIGGWDATNYFNTVQAAKINDDGSLGDFIATTNFSTARMGHASVIYKGYIYVIGGYNRSLGQYFSDVQYARVSKGAIVDVWRNGTALPKKLVFHSLVVVSDHLYIMGGWDGSALSNIVYFAPIIAGIGEIGSWSKTEAFAAPRIGHKSVAYNGHIYVIGGHDKEDIQYAKVNDNGTLQPWKQTTSLVMMI